MDRRRQKTSKKKNVMSRDEKAELFHDYLVMFEPSRKSDIEYLTRCFAESQLSQELLERCWRDCLLWHKSGCPGSAGPSLVPQYARYPPPADCSGSAPWPQRHVNPDVGMTLEEYMTKACVFRKAKPDGSGSHHGADSAHPRLHHSADFLSSPGSHGSEECDYTGPAAGPGILAPHPGGESSHFSGSHQGLEGSGTTHHDRYGRTRLDSGGAAVRQMEASFSGAGHVAPHGVQDGKSEEKMEKKIPQSYKVEWVTEMENAGHFFINKVQLGTDRIWQPRHFVDCLTEVCSLGDLVTGDGLQRALVVNNAPLSEAVMSGYFPLFPATADLTVIAQGDKDCAREAISVILCAKCHQGWVERGDASFDNKTECDECRRATFLACAETQDCKFLLLRYTEYLRIVISSAPLDRFHWEKLAQFGWYCDLPICPAWGDTSCSDETEFQSSLSSLLTHLRVDPLDYLSSVRFSGLSPCVHLITALSGSHKPEVAKALGQWKINALLKTVHWPFEVKQQSVCQAHRIGKLHQVLQMFFKGSYHCAVQGLQFPNLKVVYPSVEYLEKCLENLTQEEQEKAKTVFENRFASGFPYLHNLDSVDPVLPHANVYMQYQEVADEINPDRLRRYGWMVTGSQTVGLSCWGDKKKMHGRHQSKFFRSALGVAIFPHVIASDTGCTIHALDLSQVALQFSTPIAYSADEMPIKPSASKLARHLGVVTRIALDKAFGFLRQFSTDHPLAQFSEPYPDSPELDKKRNQEAYFHMNLLDHFCSTRPPGGTVVEFIGGNEGRGFKLLNVLRMFKSEEEAMIHFNVEETQRRAVLEGRRTAQNKMAEILGHEGQGQRKLINKSKYPDLFFEETREEKLEKPFQNIRQNLLHKICPTRRDMFESPALAMTPTRISDHMVWLEKHVTTACNGFVPNAMQMKGPFSLHVLNTGIEAHRNKHVVLKASEATAT